MAKTAPSILGSAMSGSAGSVTFRRTANGVQVLPRTRPHDPRTAAQVSARVRMMRVGEAWRGMTLAQSDAWREYALRISPPGIARPLSAQLVFSRLSIRLLQIDPNALLPLTPPMSPFPGDAVLVTVAPTGGGIVFTPDRANAPGVVTELLVQRLNSIHCNAYAKKFRSKGFVAFGGAQFVELPTGAYACAVRFARGADGQSTSLMELGKVAVA